MRLVSMATRDELLVALTAGRVPWRSLIALVKLRSFAFSPPLPGSTVLSAIVSGDAAGRVLEHGVAQ